MLPPGLIALGRTLTRRPGGSAGHADQHRQEQLQPARRLRVAARREQQDRPPRRLRHLPPDRRRPGRPRPAGDQRVPLRHHAPGRRACARLLTGHARSSTSPTSATRASTRTSRAPTSTSTTSRSSASCPGDIGLRVSYIGSTMRKLLVDRDYNTLQASTVPFDPDGPGRSRAAAVPALRLLHGHRREPRRGAVQRRAVRAAAALRGGLGAERGVHAGALRQQRARYRQQHDRTGAVRPVRHREGSRSRSERRQAPGRRERDVGRARRARPGARRQHAGWADALFGGWTVSTLFQARSGQHLTPFFTGFYTTSPWNTGKPLDGLGNCFCGAWRPDQIGDPNTGGSRDAFFDQTAYALPADRASSATRRRAA